MAGPPPALAAGLRSIAIAGDVTNSVIVTGDDVTVQLRVDGDDPLLADLLTGSRLPTQTPRPLPLDTLPAPSPDHIGRDAEAQAVRAAVSTRPTLEIEGAADVGKTFLVRYALAGGDAGRMRDGIVYVFAKGKSYADLLQELFEAFFACAPPFLAGEQQIRRDLAGMQALVVLDSLALDRDEIRQLLLALPSSRFVLVGRQRLLGEGSRVALAGLALPDALRLIEQELGRPLDAGERPAAEDLWRLLEGHPFKLRQAAADVRDGMRTLGALAAALTPGPPTRGLADLLRAELPPADAAVVAQLAALRGDTLGVEHITALSGQPASALAALEARRLIASGSPRLRLAGALCEVVPDHLDIRRVHSHLVGWARANRSRPAAVLAEAPALLSLWSQAVDDGRDHDVIELGRSIDVAFAWGRRWGTWGLVLESVLRSARRLGDQAAEGWALHGLGTRAYALGDPATAVASLTQALRIRERLGDRPGQQATRHNLDFIAGPPPPSGDADGKPGDGGPSAGRGRVMALTLTVALIAVAGIVIALYPRSPPPIGNVGGPAPGTTTGSSTSGSTTGPPPGHTTGPTTGATTAGTTTGSPRRETTLTVSPPPDGGIVTSDRGLIHCPDTCDDQFAAGTRVTLTAQPSDGWKFDAWSGACRASDPCQLVMDQSKTVTATFRRSPPVNTAAPTVELKSTQSPATLARPGPPRALVGDDGKWINLDTHPFTYQWQLCTGQDPASCSDIAGQATAIFYPPATGGNFRLLVTATNDAGASTPAPSAMISVAALP